MNNIEPINNIYQQPDTFEKQLFHSSDRNIVKLLKNHATYTCRDLISEEYIKSAFNSFNRGYVYKVDDIIVGFVIWNIKSHHKYSLKVNREGDNPIKKYLYILLICTDINNYKFGTQLLYDVEQFAIKHKIETVMLEPANNDLVIFYEKNGYNKTSILPTTIMAKKIYITPIKSTRKTLRKSLISKFNQHLPVELQNDFNYNVLADLEQ